VRRRTPRGGSGRSCLNNLPAQPRRGLPSRGRYSSPQTTCESGTIVEKNRAPKAAMEVHLVCLKACGRDPLLQAVLGQRRIGYRPRRTNGHRAAVVSFRLVSDVLRGTGSSRKCLPVLAEGNSPIPCVTTRRRQECSDLSRADRTRWLVLQAGLARLKSILINTAKIAKSSQFGRQRCHVRQRTDTACRSE